MSKIKLLSATIIGVLVLGPQVASAQRATERYIPIGQSPGLSGVYTYVGEISAVDRQAGTVTFRGQQGERTVRVTDTTEIWVDKTSARQTNTVGAWSDLVVGRRAEVRYTDYERRDAAAWIKVAGR